LSAAPSGTTLRSLPKHCSFSSCILSSSLQRRENHHRSHFRSQSRITPPEATAPKAMREARACYDHLAGTAAVLIYDFMQAEG